MKINLKKNREMNRNILIGLTILVLALGCKKAAVENVEIFYDATIPQFEFAAHEVKNALEEQGFTAELKSLLELSEAYTNQKVIISDVTNSVVKKALKDQGGNLEKLNKLGAQAFSLQTTVNIGQKTYWALGGDVLGTLYGGLQLTESITFNKMAGVYNEEQSPYIENRGIKLNIALDEQITSLKSTGDQDKKSVKDVWDLGFWKSYFDELVHNRYNVLSIWIKHPFPAMVKLEDYPEVALNNVTDGYGNVIKTMSIEEKIAFWQEVLQYSEDRSIDVYFITWNIEMHASNGKHGITEEGTNETTIDYVRKSVKQFLLNYPTVDGIGTTAGEHMPKMTDDEKEDWIWRTYGEGILDAKAENPNREIRFIHRYWWSNVDDIMKHFVELKGPFDFSFKYSRAHMYSSTNPPFEDFLYDQLPEGTNCWWNIRNDDIFYFRWGDPEYAREFILNFNKEKTAGYFMGSDGYTWGRVYSSKDETFQGKLEFQKHWYKYMIWGRLGYNPNLSTDVFKNHIKHHFPNTEKENIYEGWKSASKVIPQITRFFWRDWDFMWYPEGCKSNKGFFTVNDFINGATMEGSNILSIPEYVSQLSTKQKSSQITPLDVADNLNRYASEALDKISGIDDNGNAELRLTLNDIKSFSYLGYYYSEKIKGATKIAMYDKNLDTTYYNQSVVHMENALSFWKQYAEVSSSQYHAQKFARTGKMDWNELTEDVLKDIELVSNRNVPLSATISIVKNGDSFKAGQNLDVIVKVQPTSGIASVDLYLNDKLVRKISKAPYEWGYAKDTVFKNVPEGVMELKVVVRAISGKEVDELVSIKIESE